MPPAIPRGKQYMYILYPYNNLNTQHYFIQRGVAKYLDWWPKRKVLFTHFTTIEQNQDNKTSSQWPVMEKQPVPSWRVRLYSLSHKTAVSSTSGIPSRASKCPKESTENN